MRHFWTTGILLVLPLFFLWGCDNDTSNGDIGNGGPIDPGGPEPTDLTCIGCHSSRESLEDALAGKIGPVLGVPNKDDG